MDINTVTKAKGQLIINSKICQFLAINRKQREGLEMTKSQLYDIIKCLSSIIIKSFEQLKPQSANCPSVLARFSRCPRSIAAPSFLFLSRLIHSVRDLFHDVRVPSEYPLVYQEPRNKEWKTKPEQFYAGFSKVRFWESEDFL